MFLQLCLQISLSDPTELSTSKAQKRFVFHAGLWVMPLPLASSPSPPRTLGTLLSAQTLFMTFQQVPWMSFSPSLTSNPFPTLHIAYFIQRVDADLVQKRKKKKGIKDFFAYWSELTLLGLASEALGNMVPTFSSNLPFSQYRLRTFPVSCGISCY